MATGGVTIKVPTRFSNPIRGIFSVLFTVRPESEVVRPGVRTTTKAIVKVDLLKLRYPGECVLKGNSRNPQ